MKKVLAAIFCTSMAFSISVCAEGSKLSADEAQALFSNKTFDGFNESKGKPFQVFSSADGEHVLKKKSGKIKKFAWRVDKRGRHCVDFGSKEKCSKVMNMGGGVYHKVTYGEHTHTLKNFVDGDQL